jgi:hypothetical protein
MNLGERITDKTKPGSGMAWPERNLCLASGAAGRWFRSLTLGRNCA